MKDSFLTNYTDITFLNNIRDAFRRCRSFALSISFIKNSGLALIEREIEEALERGVQGKIITSTYQNFTDITSLQKFLNWQNTYPNFECHLDTNSGQDGGFHSKGYIFEYEDSYEFIVGSTNITRFALLKNVEWNVSLVSKDHFDSFRQASVEFFKLWEDTKQLNSELVNNYRTALDYAIEKWDMDYYEVTSDSFKPNSMQRKALKELRRYRDTGVTKALIIAATGSGKTYLAAFDARNFDAKRVLYIVHTLPVLNDAKATFMKVFGATRSYSFFTGKNKDINCDFIFATNVMLSAHLDEFSPDDFDYIIMDECHHAVASSYQKIIQYFKPSFLLGLTATPERMDNLDVFSLFEKNVPFELRLRDAIINDLVVPFKYYAIRDEFADYSGDDMSKIAREIAKANNVSFIASQIDKHKPQHEKLKALAFCTSIAHAKLMAEELCQQGYVALSLTGSDDVGQRYKAFDDLQNDNADLEIICSVDILNEGVDIPSVNMVLFLRPTESPTIFLQQLGRGLRKYQNKPYVTVLDFIGNNYERSVQIAMALGSLGVTTYTEKSYLMDLVSTDFVSLGIPGVEIFFDDLSKVEILDHLRYQNFNKTEFLKKDYQNFKNYLKCIGYPTHMDYLDCDISPDLMRFTKANIGGKVKSYYTFLKKIDEHELPLFNDSQVKVIDEVSDLLPLVRPDEYLIIEQLLEGYLDFEQLEGTYFRVSKETLKHALWLLDKKGITVDGKLIATVDEDFKKYMVDLLRYGITRWKNEFGTYDGEYKFLGNYYKEQIQMMRLKLGLMSVKGTEFEVDTGVTYCYVGLNKDSNVDDRLKYKDKFIDARTFQWESETNTRFDSAVGKKILNTKKVHLFVRKMKSENGITLPFTYIGTGTFTNFRESFTQEGDKKLPTILVDIILDQEIPHEYYLDFNIPEVIGE